MPMQDKKGIEIPEMTLTPAEAACFEEATKLVQKTIGKYVKQDDGLYDAILPPKGPALGLLTEIAKGKYERCLASVGAGGGR